MKRIDYDSPMRLLCLILVLLTASLSASESAYPLWDTHESVADYAKRVNLPPTKTLDLGNGVKLELVLIPAGNFMMGTPEPTPLDETRFKTKIVAAQVFLAASGSALLILLGFVLVQSIRKRRRLQLSLRLLLLVTVAAGGCVLSGLHWRRSAKGLQAARLEYTAAKARFKNASGDETPAHSVTLTQPYYMAKYDVTQEQYQAVIGMNPSNFIGKDNPVEQVSWNDAQEFCNKLTKQTESDVRLPNEAEWEYACRAGTTTEFYSGDLVSNLDRAAWYSANSKSTTHPVGQKEPNTFGLYDMHGNVWQWCQDQWDYYAPLHSENSQGPSHRDSRLLRGGSWHLKLVRCRSATRGWDSPDNRRSSIGLRIVMPAFTP